MLTNRHHWDYFIVLEEDVQKLTRFIHFSQANFNTYSIELARLLMASTQEIDVLFKQICANHGDSTNEPGYRAFFSKGDYAKIRNVRILCPRNGLNFTPFATWDKSTPEWWTANNKVKHERHLHFERASLGNVLDSLSALLIANIYFANDMATLSTDTIPRGLLVPEGLVRAVAVGRTDLAFRMPP